MAKAGAIRGPRRAERVCAAALALGLALGTGEAAAQICSGTLTTGHTGSIWCDRSGAAANIHINLRDPAISTTSTAGFGAGARHQGAARRVDIDLTGGSITTTGQQAYGVVGWYTSATGVVEVVMRNVDVRTSGFNAFGVVTISQGTGAVPLSIDIEGGSVETTGFPSHAIFGWRQRGEGDVSIKLRDVDVKTTNAGTAHAIIAQHAGTTGDVIVDVRGGSIETSGQQAFGVFGRATRTSGDNKVSVADTSIMTRGRFARAVAATHEGTGDVAVDVSGGTTATSEGEGGEGVYAIHAGSGDVGVTVGADVAIKAPFDTGIYGHQSRSTGVPGRVVITARGTIEALNSGILAWVEPRSGHTFGDGGVATGGGDVTQPMIHITSSGDITVGAGVRDAYIRAAIAGEDGTLSAAEQDVFNAIVADNSDALDTALMALPATYTDAWKARARGFRAARAATPTDLTSHVGGADPSTPAQAQAFEAAAEILQLPRTGIRAMALSHTAIANFIRQSDTDPAIIAISAASRTAEQRAALAAQHMLSAAERRVLAAVLDADRRGDLEAALAVLPVNAVSPNAWKDAIRRFALGYSTGDIRVDVTGGTVVSEGDGVHARYAMMHDRNGAIAVSVDKGAEVSGWRNGLYVGAAGLVEDGALRDQTVTVNGAVMGGTGAGVHLAGGGTLMVGKTGRIGATSGVGVLSEGAGALVATVDGTVEGDIRAMGGGDLDATISGTVDGDLRAMGGALTVDVQEGGAVTGTVHDPVGPLTLHGSIGRLLYTTGGTVTVADTGRLTGVEVEGRTEAIRSETGNLAVTVASMVRGDIRTMGGGDLDATISGTVDGDLLAQGGALRLNLMEGSAVTGTVHDPVGPLTLRASSIGRLLYTTGGTVTVADTGRLTGVEVEGRTEAIRSDAGDLAVTVAGAVRGDIRAMGGGDLDATISGTVDGDLLAQGGALRLNLMEGSAVTGTVHDPVGPLTLRASSIGRLLYTSGGTVTVADTGRLTGVEVGGRTEAIRSETGDLALSVAGRVQGDIRALGDGDLTARVMGTVEGDVFGQGAGEHTVTVANGGMVTGTVRLDGGTVTVADTGRLMGVAVGGRTEAIRSDAGDLAVAVAGRVTGDVIGRGTGEHTVTVANGGMVTGTVRLDGGTVTVADTGRLTGVAVEGRTEAIRSDSGDLAVTVAGMVQGDIRALGDGDLTARVMGTVDGNVEGLGGGEHVVAVPLGGTVTGTVRLAGSTVTVGGTVGRVTLENSGMVTVAQTGRVTGVPDGGHGVEVGAGSTVTNRGTIEGKVGIRAGAGSTVVNYGTIRSTDGETGVAIDVANNADGDLVILKPDSVRIGSIRQDRGDTADLSELSPAEVGTITFVDEDGAALPLDPARIRLPTRGGGRNVVVGNAVVSVPTVFALADEVLSDLTGSIHAAVGASGSRPGPRPAAGHVWATPFGGARDQNGDHSLADATHYFGGGMFGAGWGGDALHVGGFLGGSTGRLAVDHVQDVDMQTVFGGVYAQQAEGDVRLNARFLFGHVSHDSARRVGRRTAAVKYTSVFISPELGVAMALPLTSKLHVMPRLRVRYAGLITEGFREQTVGMNLQVADRTVHIVEARGEVGMPIALAGGGQLEPRIGLEGRSLLGGEKVQVSVPGGMGTARVSAGGDQVVGTGTLGFGLALPLEEALSLVGNFDGALTTEHAWRATGYLGLTYSF